MTDLREIEANLSDEQRVKLSEMRGGCSCHLSPPCGNCTDPLTEGEAEELGLLPSDGDDE